MHYHTVRPPGLQEHSQRVWSSGIELELQFPAPAGTPQCLQVPLQKHWKFMVFSSLVLTVSLMQLLFLQLSGAVKPLLSFVFQLWMKAPENLDLALLSHLVEIMQSSRYKHVLKSETFGTNSSVTWSWNFEVDMKDLIPVGISGFWEWIIPVLLFKPGVSELPSPWDDFGARLGKDIWLPGSHGTTPVQWKFKYLLRRGNLNVWIDYEIIF